MKNLTIISAFFLLFTVASCKCTTCKKDGGSKVRLCEKDYDNNTANGIAIDAYEVMGYECN